MAQNVPSFVVAGAGRAGTTGLVEGLRAHPDVFVTTPKEPHYLALHGTRADFRGPGDRESINATAVTRERDYRALFPEDPRPRHLGEGSVSTLYHHERALPELLRISPEARVVVLLREPVARAWSSFCYLRAQGREPEEDFLVALDDERRRRAGGWHHLWHYDAMSRYADALAALQDALPSGHLGVWFHDDLERDYAGTLAEVTRFLGLTPADAPTTEAPRVNISGTPRYPLVQRAVTGATRSPTLRKAVRGATSWRLREAVRERLLRRDPVPVAITDEVAPRFVDDLARLRQVLPPTVAVPGWLAGTRSRA